MLENYFTITRKDLFDLFGRLNDGYKIIVPYAKGDRLYFDEFDPKKEDHIELGVIRQSQPLKSFINPPREKILNGTARDKRPVIIAGVKGCDLSSLVLQDFVFQGEGTEDPFYAENRRKSILIGSDCTTAHETCFCLAMDGAPYPTKYFDINLAAIDNYFLVEIASGKGRSIVDNYRPFFKDAGSGDIGKRQKERDRVSKIVEDFIKKRNTQGTVRINGAVRKNYNLTELWNDFASTCVECGACNLVCPTCHCFLLFDERKDSANRRHRIWDACLYKNFARVAGNSNPRKHLYERLRNRFEKKFDFFPQVLNYFACTGCGRCIEACPGDIDLREVLKGLVLGKWNKPPND